MNGHSSLRRLSMMMLLGLAVAAHAAPQTFNTALPVADGTFVLREQLVYRRATQDPGPAGRKLTVRGAVSVLGYGVTGRLALFGVVPWLDKSLDLAMPGGRATRGASGLGDARLFARYTLYQRDAPGRTLRIAPFLGTELPTGRDGRSDALGPLPRPLQVGSGSWDAFAGVVASYQTLRYEVDAEASVKLNSEADGFEFGNEARLAASLQYRVWPRRLAAGTPGFLYTVVEGSLTHRERNRANGTKDPDSGGTSLFLAPGIQYVTRRWIIEALVQLPVHQNLGGNALEDDYTVRAGFRRNF